MSMNIHLTASCEAVLTSNNINLGKKIIYENFDCFQTPTEITRKILNSTDPKSEYINWVKEKFYKNEKIEMFEEILTDNFEFIKGEYIGYRIENPGRDHIKLLNRFLTDHENWKIVWYEL